MRLGKLYFQKLIPVLFAGAIALAQKSPADSPDYFENKIRPILANNCYSCHTDSKLGGLRVDYTSLIAQDPFRRGFIPEGVMVSDIQSDSAAERANLRIGDIITHVNGVKVTTPRAFYDAEFARRGQSLELTVQYDAPTKILLKTP